MNSQTVGLRVASVIFALICVMHLVRLVAGFEVLVATHPFPMWTSPVAVVIFGALSIWMWRLSGGASPGR
jgi:hypothetical protein